MTKENKKKRSASVIMGESDDHCAIQIKKIKETTKENEDKKGNKHCCYLFNINSVQVQMQVLHIINRPLNL